jgi:hypothetical protein
MERTSTEKLPKSDPNIKRNSTKCSGNKYQYTILYKPPILQARKPRNLTGPFDVYDVPEIRHKIHDCYKNDKEHRRQDALISYAFVQDLNLNDYFLKKSNWLNRPKFLTTYSLYTAVHTYLPNYKRVSTLKSAASYINGFQYKMKPEIKRSFSSSKTIQKETNLYDESKIIESSVNRMK